MVTAALMFFARQNDIVFVNNDLTSIVFLRHLIIYLKKSSAKRTNLPYNKDRTQLSWRGVLYGPALCTINDM